MDLNLKNYFLKKNSIKILLENKIKSLNNQTLQTELTNTLIIIFNTIYHNVFIINSYH